MSILLSLKIWRTSLLPIMWTCVNALSLNIWVEVPEGRDWVQITSISVVTTASALLWPSWMKLLLSITQVCSVSDKGEFLKSGEVLYTWATTLSHWWSGLSKSGSGERVPGFRETRGWELPQPGQSLIMKHVGIPESSSESQGGNHECQSKLRGSLEFLFSSIQGFVS